MLLCCKSEEVCFEMSYGRERVESSSWKEAAAAVNVRRVRPLWFRGTTIGGVTVLARELVPGR